MSFELSPPHRDARERFRRFAEAEVAPVADQIDRDEAIPRALIARLAAEGLLVAALRPQDGGLDAVSTGLLCEELGRVSSSVRSLVTVQGMTAQALARWGSREQRRLWLPRLEDGTAVIGFALTEPNVGSDAKAVDTSLRPSGRQLRLNGTKKWISFAQIADVFLVLARLEDRPTVVLVERTAPGVSVQPIRGILGDRGAMLGIVSFDECELSTDAIVGRVGLGLTHVASTALDSGRFTLAWGCVGIARACLEDSSMHAVSRRQFGAPLGDHQLVRRLLARMHVDVQAARLLCLQAAHRREAGDPQNVADTLVAKYFASRVATRSASDAVQIHGAIGCSRERRVERYFRDARLTEIIEGTTQIQELLIGQHVLQGLSHPAAVRAGQPV